MPRLTNPQIEQLLDAMQEAFTTDDALDELLQLHCDRRLAQIVSPGDNLPTATRKVINAANAEGWIADLLRGVAEERQGLASLQELVAGLLAVAEPPPPDPAQPPPEPGPLPPGSRPGFPRNAAFTGRADAPDRGDIPNAELQKAVAEIAVCKSAPDVIYAIIDNSVFMSRDRAVTWSYLNRSAGRIAVDPFDAATVYALQANGVHVSHDFGENWRTTIQGPKL